MVSGDQGEDGVTVEEVEEVAWVKQQGRRLKPKGT